MTLFSEAQRNFLTRLEEIVLSSRSHLPNTLVYGPQGSGKRTLTRALADSLGLATVEVNLSDSAEFIRMRLFGKLGNTTEATATGVIPGIPGELGQSSEMVLLLTGLECTSPDLFQDIHRLLTKRSYIDANGNVWMIGTDVWIIAILTEWKEDETNISVALNHWICTCFEHQLRLDKPERLEDLEVIAKSMLEKQNTCLLETPDLELLETVQNAPDCLHALRRWLTNSVPHAGIEGGIDRQRINDAILNDLKTIFSRLRFRGGQLDSEKFEKWAAQFGALRPTAIHLLQWIARAYFISDREYFEGIDFLIRRSGIPRGSRVIFCRWQTEGQSGPRLAHQIKNFAHWRILPGCDIDLNDDGTNWPKICETSHPIVLVDDFIGSGKTMAKLFVGDNAPLRRLLSKFTGIRLWIGILIGYDSAIQSIIAAIGEFNSRVSITPYRLLTEQDKCFVDTSRILTNQKTREQLRAFCWEVAERHCHLPPNLRLGFDNTGALVVFYDSVPNNTIPIIWHDEGTWFPLFPAAGI